VGQLQSFEYFQNTILYTFKFIMRAKSKLKEILFRGFTTFHSRSPLY
jgi:hypothetical protein